MIQTEGLTVINAKKVRATADATGARGSSSPFANELWQAGGKLAGERGHVKAALEANKEVTGEE